MNSKKRKIDSDPIYYKIYAHAAKVKGLSHLLGHQDLEMIFPDEQEEINEAISMILEDLAIEIRAVAVAVEKALMPPKK